MRILEIFPLLLSGFMSNAPDVRKNTEYKGITFTKTGAAKNCQDTKIMLQTVKTVATVTKPDMTKKQKLKACWKYLTKKKNFRYISKYPDLKKKGWQRKTAENMLKTKKEIAIVLPVLLRLWQIVLVMTHT